MEYIGDIQVTTKYMGNTEVLKQYVGNTLVWEETQPTPPQHDYSQDYLSFRITSPGDIKWSASYSSANRTIQYSKDGGTTWTSVNSYPESTIQVVSGDVLLFKGTNAGYSNGNTIHAQFKTDVSFSIEGNIMSLISGDNFTGNTTLTTDNTFDTLFQACTGLTSAGNLILPATTLATKCYKSMFYGCSSLTTAPALPATTLANACYQNMFRNCNLTATPALPATSLEGLCYSYMFAGCTGLTTVPSILPATTLANACYQNMFDGCSSLASAPVLPATGLTIRCYQGMFQNTSLATAPELPAPTLVNYCYQQMFAYCGQLNYVKCLATDISASNCTNQWLDSVAASGTFVKAKTMEGWSRGNAGIPNN